MQQRVDHRDGLCEPVFQKLVMLTEVLSQNIPMPSKSALSRARCIVDVAYMLMWRDVNGQHPDTAHYLMVDSSPQFGRDYEALLRTS